MANVQLIDSGGTLKVLLVGGKVAVDPACCCDPCVECTAMDGVYGVELVGCQDGMGGTFDTSGSISITNCSGSGGPTCAANCGVSFVGLLAMNCEGQWWYVISGAGGEFSASYAGPTGGGSPTGSYSFSSGSSECGWPASVTVSA